MSSTPPSHFVTNDDHGAWLTSVGGILMSWMLLTLALRVFIRLRFNGPWMKDDTACTIGSVLAIIQTAILMAAVSNGYGKKMFLLDASQVLYVQKSIYASDILYIASLAGSKISTSFLIARLTRRKSHTYYCLVINALSFLWGIAGILAISLRCDLSHPWTFNANTGYCTSQFSRWIGIETVSMLIETLLFILPVTLVWSLHMALRLKAIVVMAFSSRILILVPTAIRLHYLSPSQNQPVLSPNGPNHNNPMYEPLFTGILAALATQAVMHYALIAATVPCTKPFMKAFAGSLAVPSEVSSSNGGTGAQSAYGAGYGRGYGLGSSGNASRHRSMHTRGSSITKPILNSNGPGSAHEKTDILSPSSAGRDSAFSHSRGPSGGSAIGGQLTTINSAGMELGAGASPLSRPRPVRSESGTSKASSSNIPRSTPAGWGHSPHAEDSPRFDPGAGEVTAVVEQAGSDSGDSGLGAGSNKRNRSRSGTRTTPQRILLESLARKGKRDGTDGSDDGSADWQDQMVIRKTKDVDVNYELRTSHEEYEHQQ